MNIRCNARFCILVGLMVLGVLCTIGNAAADNTTGTQGMQPVDTIQPYNGPIGADSSLYGLKIAFENLDEAFTFNQSERLDKEIDHSDLRLAELESALAANKTDAADQALDQYWQKMNQTGQTLELFNGTGFMPGYNGTYNETYNRTWPMSGFNGTGSMPSPSDDVLVHAQEMILSHQIALENLLLSHPDNTGLLRAYNNSYALEQKFEQKTLTQFEISRDTDNRPMFRAEHLNSSSQNQVQNQTIPAHTQRGRGFNVNETIPAEWNQTGERDRAILRGNEPVLAEPAAPGGNPRNTRPWPEPRRRPAKQKRMMATELTNDSEPGNNARDTGTHYG